MPGSKTFDKYWVDGTVKRTFRKSIYAQMLVKKLQCMPLGETKDLEAQYTCIVAEITEMQSDPTKCPAPEEIYAEMCKGTVIEVEKKVVEVKEEVKVNTPAQQAQAKAAEGWTEENLTQLAKQMEAFPAGTGQRMKAIATAMGMPLKEVDKKVSAIDKKAKADAKKNKKK